MATTDIDPTEPTSRSTPKPPRTIEERLRFALIVVAVTTLVVRIALPFTLEWMIPKVAATQDLHLEIGNIDLGLIAGEIALEDLVVDFLDPSSKGAEALLSLDRLYVAFEWTDLVFRRIHITDLEFDHPTIRVTQLADGSLDLPVPPSDPAPVADDPDSPDSHEQPAEAVADPAWEFVLDRFDLKEPDLALQSETMQTEVVRVAAEQLAFDALSVGPDGIGLGDIALEHPELFVQRDWLFSQGASPETSEVSEVSEPEPQEVGAPATEMLVLRMNHLNIERAAFTLRTADGPVEVALRLGLTDVGTEADQVFPIDIGLQIDEGTLGLEGQLGLNPPSFEGQLQWKNLGVPPFLRLVSPELIAWLASCDADGNLQIAFHSDPENEAAGLNISGATSVSILSFKHPETGDLALEWDALEIELDEVVFPLEATSENPPRIAVSRVALASPQIVFTNPPEALDELLATLSGGGTPNEEATAEPEAQPSPEPEPSAIISVREVELTDGLLRYVDHGVNPSHETKVHDLHVRLSGLATTPTPGVEKIAIGGLIQAAGTFTLDGTLPGGEGELDFVLRHLDLVSYDSMARPAGWEIESGTTSLESSIVASGGGYRTRNKLVLHDLDVASQDSGGFASSFGVSADLALALLRDPSGDITLSIPVSVDPDGGAGIDLQAIFLSATRNALQGALASPMKMLGTLAPKSEDADALGALPFEPGQEELADEAQARLVSLAQLLESRPMLSLSLSGHWGNQDRTPTARKVLGEKMNAGEALANLEGVSSRARRRVENALRSESPGAQQDLSTEDQALLARYIAEEASATTIEPHLVALAETRANSLRTTLVELGAPTAAVRVGTLGPAEQPSVSIDLGASGATEPAATP